MEATIHFLKLYLKKVNNFHENYRPIINYMPIKAIKIN